jgi:hypothetical protein
MPGTWSARPFFILYCAQTNCQNCRSISPSLCGAGIVFGETPTVYSEQTGQSGAPLGGVELEFHFYPYVFGSVSSVFGTETVHHLELHRGR